MTIINPCRLSGSLNAPPSKSQAHRALIAAALAESPTRILIGEIPRDVRATADCLSALGAKIVPFCGGLEVHPITELVSGAVLPCAESGSTLRFLMPVVGVFGVSAVFLTEGRLSERPMQDFEDELVRHGMNITHSGREIHCSGRLFPGQYRISGNITSQYLSGLLLALPCADGESTVTLTTPLESSGYVRMTKEILCRFGAEIETNFNQYHIKSARKYRIFTPFQIEGDFSSAAFFLCAGAISSAEITVGNLSSLSVQGDRAIVDLLKNFGAELTVTSSSVTIRGGALTAQELDVSEIPDLAAPLAVVAAFAEGTTRIYRADRLHHKESDRLQSIYEMLVSLGADVRRKSNELFITGKPVIPGGSVKTYHDHRIAMSAAIASVGCESPLQIDDADCVGKSFPRFWEEFHRLEAIK